MLNFLKPHLLNLILIGALGVFVYLYVSSNKVTVEAKAKYEELKRANDTTTSLLKRAQDSLSSCKKQTSNTVTGKQNNKGKR